MFQDAANQWDIEEVGAEASPANLAVPQQRDTTNSRFKLIPTEDEGELRAPEMTFDVKNVDVE